MLPKASPLFLQCLKFSLPRSDRISTTDMMPSKHTKTLKNRDNHRIHDMEIFSSTLSVSHRIDFRASRHPYGHGDRAGSETG